MALKIVISSFIVMAVVMADRCGRSYGRPHKFVDLLKMACDIYKPNRGGSTNEAI
jgi:hypothetical protein